MILDALKRLWSGAKVVKGNADGLAAWNEAYAAGAGLPGCLLAFTGATPAAGDNLAPAAVMERVDGLHRVVAELAGTAEHGSQTAAMVSKTLADAAGELRELEGFLAALRGGKPLRELLEGR